jgi:hypothetical protein
MLYGDFDVAQSEWTAQRESTQAWREGHTELREIKGSSAPLRPSW